MKFQLRDMLSGRIDVRSTALIDGSGASLP